MGRGPSARECTRASRGGCIRGKRRQAPGRTNLPPYGRTVNRRPTPPPATTLLLQPPNQRTKKGTICKELVASRLHTNRNPQLKRPHWRRHRGHVSVGKSSGA